MRSKTRLTRTLALAFVAFAAASPLKAQYFGKNRVQYQSFDFQIIKTEHFDIYYYEEEREAAHIAARLAERWYARLSRLLNHQLRSRQTVIFYASGPHFRQTNAVPGGPGDEGVGGVTESGKRRVVMPFAGPLAETDHVLGHELVHAFQYDITTFSSSQGAMPVLNAMPLWFVEGMAEYLSLGPEDAHTAMWLREATRNKLPEIRNLERAATPYRYGHAFWAYVGGRWGDEMVSTMLKASVRMGLEGSMLALLKVKEKDLSQSWHQSLHEAYDSIRPLTRDASVDARLLRGEEGEGYNLAPALSPDGTQMAFLSVGDLYSIEMFLADVETGKVQRSLVKTSTDPHFESLQFINSAGAWAPDGQHFALGGIVKGEPSLTVINVEDGNRVHEATFEDLGEIFNPTWSPDSKRIAFSAIVGGLTDLFVYEPATKQLARLTNDPFADLQPAWSPSGNQIAFVTDRFSSDLERLSFGDYRLGLINLDGGNIQPVAAFEKGKHVNPQWSPDGSSLYFINDQTGVANVYRMTIATGDLAQITNVFSGVSGITDLSPALSVSARTGDVAFTVFENEEMHIYFMPAATAIAATTPQQAGEITPAMLPPQDRALGPVQTALADVESGLPIDSAFAQRRYSTKMTLDGVIRPTLGVGADQYGTLIGGGTGLWFSDMLGEHHLFTGIELQGSLKDIAAGLSYLNLKRRINWGASVTQTPYQFYQYRPAFSSDANGIFEDSIYRFRQTSRSVGGNFSYPFNRVQRLDVSANYTNISYGVEVDVEFRDLLGQLVDRTSESIDANLSSLNLASTSVALVYDNSVVGYLGPVVGQRWRIEASPSFGSLTWVNALVDFRRYFMPVRPFTLGIRALHVGRYGPDAEANELRSFFLGYGQIVRGYFSSSFSTRECSATQGPQGFGCPEFERLFGSKLAVGNAELRFPLLGALGVGEGYYGFFPVDMVFFGDAGLAWTEAEKPWFSSGPRKPVYSAGSALRIYLFGLVGEIALVHPFNRPSKNWVWQFTLGTGGF